MSDWASGFNTNKENDDEPSSGFGAVWGDNAVAANEDDGFDNFAEGEEASAADWATSAWGASVEVE